MARKIVVSTNKGGVLKTSISVNLAGLLSRENKKVLLVDTDNQGNVILSFGQNPDNIEISIFDILIGKKDIKKAIQKNVVKNIDILPSNDDMNNFEVVVLKNIKQYPEPFKLLQRKLNEVEHLYDYIIIDTPPNLGLVQGIAVTAADEVIIPFQPENYSMRSLVKILNFINEFKEDNINPNLKVLGVIGTLVDLRTTLHTEVLEECRKFCYENNIHMFETVIPRAIRYANSIAYEGLPATLTEKNNELIKSYIDLRSELN